jgi:hypothetical protein
VTDTGSTPAAAATRAPLPYALGLAGLIPFWALALAKVTNWPPALPPGAVDFMLATYAATILSFLGGIRWGAVLRAPDQRAVATDFIFGVTPQLFGWGALLLPEHWRYLTLGLGLLVLGPIDRNIVARDLAPAWFGRLRMMLSLGAGAALFVAAFA